MFLQAPAGEGPYEISFTGEVPEARNGGGTTTVEVAGIDAVSYGYPAEVTFPSTELATSAANGSTANFWTGAGYATAVKDARGWGPTGDNKVLAIGEGFFFEPDGGGNQTWTEVQPYDLQN
jgi:hypothetical protein